jgi:demethylmenaquinone methyltransferase/2-methoxy-6-polyprenyl-1,4-benzoquinol methylase
MFNDIAPTYDMLNRIISLGFDVRWRARAIGLLEEKRGGRILDIAAGSGDLSFDAFRLDPEVVVSTDFATNMLSILREKGEKIAHRPPHHLLACDALALPFPAESFDVTMVAFGIRNFSDRLRSLTEMHRVLRPGGITMILELSEPVSPPMTWLYQVYARGVLPLVGRIVSRHDSAYRYLPASISHFPTRAEFLSLLATAGFVQTSAVRLTFGAATIFLGRKEIRRTNPAGLTEK